MTPEQFEEACPKILSWIEQTLLKHAPQTQAVASAGFGRLPHYFGPGLLSRAKFIPVGHVPTPPLAGMGLSQFSDFENMAADGITYGDTYFVRSEKAGSEKLHFHELIHVVQWLTLGAEGFLRRYAHGLELFGYRKSPLELMAYEAEFMFFRNSQPFDAEKFVKERLALLP